MFNRLFVRSDALVRQLSAPLADERRQYLASCEEQGMSRKTLRAKARILLSISNHLKLVHRLEEQIDIQEIGRAATRWSRKKRSSPSERLQEQFVSEAVAWLTFHVALENGYGFQLPSFIAERHIMSNTTEELKFDGYRAIEFKWSGRVQLRSRSDKDFTQRYRAVAKALEELPDNTVLVSFMD